MRTKEPIKFKSIPCPGSGYIALEIYRPGTWFDNTDFAVFVGGSGVGHAPTLPAAKKLLLAQAKEACQRRIREAEAIAAHYRAMEARLKISSLQRG